MTAPIKEEMRPIDWNIPQQKYTKVMFYIDVQQTLKIDAQKYLVAHRNLGDLWLSAPTNAKRYSFEIAIPEPQIEEPLSPVVIGVTEVFE